MAITSTALAITSLVATVAATGVSLYASQQQASQQADIANYNRAVQEQNSKLNYQMTMAGINVQQQQYKNQVAAQNQNAQILTDEGRQKMAETEAQIQRTEQEKAQMIGKQRAAYAAAGVLSEGTPLAVLSDTAGLYGLKENDQLYAGEIEKRKFDWEAQVYKSGAQVTGWQSSLTGIDAAAAAAQYRIGQTTAGINYLSGMDKANATATGGFGTLLSGFGAAANQSYNLYQRGAFSAS